MNTRRKPSIARRATVGILDSITAFAVGGYVIAKLTGNISQNGFQLNGMPAIVLFALIVAYFVVCTIFLDGTLWQRILRTR